MTKTDQETLPAEGSQWPLVVGLAVTVGAYAATSGPTHFPGLGYCGEVAVYAAGAVVVGLVVAIVPSWVSRAWWRTRRRPEGNDAPRASDTM